MSYPRAPEIPAWKRSYLRKAVRLRNALTDKELIARLQVSRRTIVRASEYLR